MFQGTHEVYLAPHEDETPLDHQAVQLAARHVLPVAPAQHYETLPVVLESFHKLRREADIVLVEGAGSAAEINLRANDIANMGFAQAADVPVVLIGAAKTRSHATS